MAEKLNLNNISRFAAFAAAIFAVTGRANDFSVRPATLGQASGTQALQIVKLSSSAHVMVSGQLAPTYHQREKAKITARESNEMSSPVETAQRMAISRAVVLGSASVLAKAVKKLSMAWTVANQVTGGSRAVVTTSRYMAESSGWLATKVLADRESGAASEAAPTASGLGTRAYPAWRDWSPLLIAMQAAAKTAGDELITFVSKIASATDSAFGDFGGISGDNVESASGETTRPRSNRRGVDRTRSIALSSLGSIATVPTRAATRAFVAFNQPGLLSDVQPRQMSRRRVAAIAIVSAPLLAAPAVAAMPAQDREHSPRVASVVIKSTPTIVINSDQPADIEHRVLDTLRQHREALFEQWQHELQRRQRTEF